jgi:hypothetical protein
MDLGLGVVEKALRRRITSSPRIGPAAPASA